MADVPSLWEVKRKDLDAKLDAAPATPIDSRTITYRRALSEFLAAQKSRVGAIKNRLSDRAYHNFVTELNAFGAFVHEGQKIADRRLREIGPRQFSAYANTFGHYKHSSFESVVSRVSALFNWCERMGYIDAYRPGPHFIRPTKQDIRDERIELQKRFEMSELAKIWGIANPTQRLWIALGLCAAFNNSDIAHIERGVIDPDTGIIDFRRRKKGRVRRVIPLPAEVTRMLREYERPEPTDKSHANLFFVTVEGNPYSRTDKGKPSCSISRLFSRLIKDAGVTHIKGRNYSGIRTTFANATPPGYADEREIIMGHARGSILLDHYLENVGMERLRHVVENVWGQFVMERDKVH